MYDFTNYEVEINPDLKLETRLQRSTEDAGQARVMVVGSNLEEVTRIAQAVRSYLRGAKDGKVVKA